MEEMDRIIELAQRHGRQAGAYRLLMMAMGYALERMEERRHLSGEEFMDWLLRMLREQFGYMGKWLLEHYRLRWPAEVGRAIFELVEAGIFSRREEDTMEDFLKRRGRLTDGYEVEFGEEGWWEREGADWRFLPVPGGEVLLAP